ncbi:MAG: type II CAAX endopeptidase family protein [Calothrix sp. MO_167.B12]|nr:type II CAAX endopeptidase family protein [Calothrix sp. MO_167.B12]
MTLKRLLLILLTLGAILWYGGNLFNSWQKPQIQSSLELYQTNILLQAQEWYPENTAPENLQAAKTAFLGKQPLETAAKQYQQVRKSATTNLEKIQKQLAKQPTTSGDNLKSNNPESQQLQQSSKQVQKLIAKLDLHLGVIQAAQKNIEAAVQTWTKLTVASDIYPDFAETALVLSGIWSDPPRILPNAQPLIENNLTGWFRFTSLSQLYKLQQREEDLSNLLVKAQETAESAVFKLGIVVTLPLLTGIIGAILFIVLLIQRIVQGKNSLWAKNEELSWSTPWDGETILQVFIFGFFCVGQFVIPLLLGVLPIASLVTNIQTQAFLVLFSYLLVAFGTLTVLYLSIKNFLPLTSEWFSLRFQEKWFLWGLGGYCVALPIVVLVSLINQKLWQGQGGSNPLLQLALDSQDSVALFILFFTAGIAAPLFEEFLFRGFLLPSLTRYVPMWGAITISSLLFAAVHLSLSEIIPLMALGMVLGFVYTRSRNLLAPMLLHSLWNSGTLMSLFILGSSGK